MKRRAVLLALAALLGAAMLVVGLCACRAEEKPASGGNDDSFLHGGDGADGGERAHHDR